MISRSIGAIFENFVAQELVTHGFEPKYYNSSKFGEIDFIVEHDGHAVPIEVKGSKHYARHSALSRLMSDPEYDFPSHLSSTTRRRRRKIGSRIFRFTCCRSSDRRPCPKR